MYIYYLQNSYLTRQKYIIEEQGFKKIIILKFNKLNFY